MAEVSADFGAILKRLYSADAVQDLASESLFGLTRTPNPTRLAGCNFNTVPAPPPAISSTAIAVVTTVAALEWLRRRKCAVAAAESSEEAYATLLGEFVAWLRRWLEVMGMKEQAR